MDDYYFGCGQLQGRVGFLDFRIIPHLDVAEKDSADRFRRKAQLLTQSRDIVSGNDGPENHGKELDRAVVLLLESRKLFVGHRHIASAKIYGAFRHGFDASTGTVCLIVDLYIGYRLILVEPFLIEGGRECGAGAGE